VFNPTARLEPLQLGDGRLCWVVDDCLEDPDALLKYAADHCAQFRVIDFNFYPGVFLDPPIPFPARLADLFNTRIRRCFDARRLLGLHCRLSMVTRSPQQLTPVQSLCHRDRPMLDGTHSIQACILYLFRDSGLGGTSFYRALRPEEDLRQLFNDAQQLPAAQFFTRYGMQPQYLSGSNDWFEKLASVPARWNRCIFFDGFCFHSGDILAPERLSADPLRGRLTLNGFFTSRRHLSQSQRSP
jgi:hypothetical protein